MSTKEFAKNLVASKSIDEAIIENAFLEMFNLLARNFDDVMKSAIQSIEETLLSDGSILKLKRIDSTLSSLKSKRVKLTDLLLDDNIGKETYDEKFTDFSRQIERIEEEREICVANAEMQRTVNQRMKDIRRHISEVTVLEKFDRTVFESLVKKVIVGEQYPDGTTEPYKITFVLNGISNMTVADVKNRYTNLNKKKVG